mgnify:CR=1 FL=1
MLGVGCEALYRARTRLGLRDGTVMQVGKSTEARRDILARFRVTLGIVTLSIVVIALTGGWIATEAALQPIRRLTTAVRKIIATGQTRDRVPVGPSDSLLGVFS